VESTIRARLDTAHAELDRVLDAAEALAGAHGVTQLATYDAAPAALANRLRVAGWNTVATLPWI